MDWLEHIFLYSTNSKNYMNETAVIYARVSSVGDRQDTSRQIRDLEILAKDKSLKVVNTYEERISGAKKTQDRPVLTECLNYCFNVDDVLSNVKLCKENHLNVYFQKEQLSIYNADGKEHPFLTIFIAVLGTCAEMERENIKFRLNSGKAKFMANGGKVGRKEGYKKPDETFQEEYATVIKQLRKGYPIRMIAKNCGVGISTVQRIKKKFIDNEQDN